MKCRNIRLLPVLVLSAAFAACTGEQEKFLPGEPVAVRFALHPPSDRGETSPARSAHSNPRTVATAPVPLPLDWQIDAALVEATDPLKQSAETISDGLVVRIVAHDAGGTWAGSALYTYHAASQSWTGDALILQQGTAYTFVAYSYHSDEAPAYSEEAATETIAPPIDLIGGKTTVTVDAEQAVAIDLHHLFSRVKINLGVSTDAGTLSEKQGAIFFHIICKCNRNHLPLRPQNVS
jgi:hypothetical protein